MWSITGVSLPVEDKKNPGNRVRIPPVILCVLLASGAPFFFLGGPGVNSARSMFALWDLGHVLFFVLASLLLSQLVESRYPHCSVGLRWGGVFAAVLVLGGLVEGVQSVISGRSPSVMDLLRNQLGCLLVFVSVAPQRRGRMVLFSRIFVSGLLGIALIPLSRALIDERIAVAQFPVISDFETPFELDRWHGDEEVLFIDTRTVRKGSGAMRVRFTRKEYSGVSLVSFPSDWRGYDRLAISVYNPDVDPLILECRINDVIHNNRYHDRFNLRFILQTGWNDLVIPLDQLRQAPAGREMDLAHIAYLKLFVPEQQTREREIVIDAVLLERQ